MELAAGLGRGDEVRITFGVLGSGWESVRMVAGSSAKDILDLII